MVGLVPETKLNTVREETPAYTVVKDQSFHQTEPGKYVGRYLNKLTFFFVQSPSKECLTDCTL